MAAIRSWMVQDRLEIERAERGWKPDLKAGAAGSRTSGARPARARGCGLRARAGGGGGERAGVEHHEPPHVAFDRDVGASHERALLQFGFAYVPHAPGQTLSIVAENLRVLLPFFAMAVLVQARRVCRTAHGRRTFRCYCDLVATVLVANDLVLPMGRSVSAYGRRRVLSVLPAGPIELAAYALATNVSLRSRRSSIGGREAPGMTQVAALSAGALLIAALIETYAT